MIRCLRQFVDTDTLVQSPYDPQTLNRYVYTRNNPIAYVDPSGHSWWKKSAGNRRSPFQLAEFVTDIAGHACLESANI